MTNIPVEKICNRCKTSKPKEEFRGHTYCPQCWVEYRKEYRVKNKEKVLSKERQYYNDNKERLKAQQRKRRKINVEYYRSRERAYRANNVDKYKSYKDNRKEIRKKEFKEWYAINRDNNITRCKKYARENRKKITQQRAKRRATDIQYRLSERIRGRLKSALRRKNKVKVGSAIRDLGCTLAQLVVYLESKFTSGMTWDNYGFYGWHVDHIKPLASFDLSNIEQFREAVHYTNLQPLWAKDNIRKGTKW